MSAKKEYTTGGRIVDRMGCLHVDLFFQDRYLINGVDVKVRLVQSKDAFALMAGGDDPVYKMRIVEAALFTRKAKLNPAVQMGHIKALEKGTAKYLLRRVDCSVFSIPRVQCRTLTKTFTSASCLREWCCAEQRRIQWSLRQERVPRKTHNLNFLRLFVDGQQVPAKPPQPRFGDGGYVRSYCNLFAGTGKMFLDE